tara:strand:+ start:190 stop:441 length:252 start_codon:yes stop_codon:yes gene_type:complete
LRLILYKKIHILYCHIRTIIKTPQKITAPKETATPVNVSNLIKINTEKIKISKQVKISSILFFSSIVSCVKKAILNISLENNL